MLNDPITVESLGAALQRLIDAIQGRAIPSPAGPHVPQALRFTAGIATGTGDGTGSASKPLPTDWR